MSSSPFTVDEGDLHVVPVCHYRFEFAHCVRRAILNRRPAAVAVELPPALQEAYVSAVERFPYMSVVHWLDTEGESMLLPVEPTDPFAEAVRTARDCGIPVHFVDLAVDRYPRVLDPMPDSYALYRIGLDHYWDSYDRLRTHRPPHLDLREDEARERHIVACLEDLTAGGQSVLLVCGMVHAPTIVELHRRGEGQKGKHSVVEDVRVLNPDLESIREISAEMPFLMAVYEFERAGSGPDGAWLPPAADEPPPPPPPPEGPSLEDVSREDLVGALESLLGLGRKDAKPQERIVDLSPEVVRALARKLRALRDPRLVFPLGGADSAATDGVPELTPAPPAGAGAHRIFKFRAVEDRRPHLRDFYESCARRARQEDGLLDRQRTLIRMLEKAALFYNENTGETLQRWQMRTLLHFARNYARLTGMLLPDFFQWIVCARGVSDDNYAYEVWDLGSFYPWSDSSGTHPTVRIHADEMWLDGKRITFRRRYPRFRERMARIPVRSRGREEHAGDWGREFERGSICSYPPEDLVIEDYGRYLKKKALLVLSEERTRTEPFSTSMLDGLDMRETIRNWPDRQRIYVREMQKVSGGAGSVVVIFDEDANDYRYPWKMTWHGENEQESDMAFYATPLHDKVVGPGIARCEYGGFMLTYPPRRVLDVWTDPFYNEARTKSEVLLLSGLEYSREKHVVYVASKPPRSFFRTVAARLGRKLVYLPIGQLSPVSIKKIRVFHVLSSHEARRIARDFIW